jgi:hypothetical protein
MEIKDILKNLNIDLTDPEARKGAMEALAAILEGRMSFDGEWENPFKSKAKRNEDDEPIDLGEQESEIDPNLIQPPKYNGGQSDVDTEIEDEDDVLGQQKQMQSNDPSESSDENGESGDESEDSSSSNYDEQNPETSETSETSESDSDTSETDSSDSGEAEPTSDKTKDAEESEANSGTYDDESETAENDSEGDADGAADEETAEDADDDFGDNLNDDNPKNKSQQIQASRTLNAAKKALEKAQQNKVPAAQTSTLETCIDLLEEVLENLKNDPTESMDENKFDQILHKTLDAIADLDKKELSFTSEEEHSSQIKKINDVMSDTITAAELSAEDAEQIRKDKQAVAATQKEIDKYARKTRSSFKGFEDFVLSLKKAMALQASAETVKGSSWAAINRKHDGTSVVMPGIKNKTQLDGKIPVIDFYFDQSGSWDDQDIVKGNEALGEIAQLEKDGFIKINIFYFAESVHSEPGPCRDEGSTGAWNYIIENIITTRASNVVIMTDSDMHHQCINGPHKGYRVPGFVWYLWRDGENAPNLPNLLQGKSGTLQYAFDSR